MPARSNRLPSALAVSLLGSASTASTTRIPHSNVRFLSSWVVIVIQSTLHTPHSATTQSSCLASSVGRKIQWPRISRLLWLWPCFCSSLDRALGCFLTSADPELVHEFVKRRPADTQIGSSCTDPTRMLLQCVLYHFTFDILTRLFERGRRDELGTIG